MFFVTTTVVSRIPIFPDYDVAVTVLEQFAETSRLRDVAIVANVLMPSHLHALVGLKDIKLLSAYMQTFKSLSSRKIKEVKVSRYKETLFQSARFRLWQRGFDDLVISSEKQFRIKLEYIHNNPVKAGLVTTAVDYPYSSARNWVGEGKGLVETDKDFG